MLVLDILVVKRTFPTVHLPKTLHPEDREADSISRTEEGLSSYWARLVPNTLLFSESELILVVTQVSQRHRSTPEERRKG